MTSINCTDKQRLFSAAENGEDYLLLAKQLQIKPQTARKIVARTKKRNGVISVPKGGARYSKVDDEMRNFIKEKVDQNCQITLTKIKEDLERRYPEKSKISTVTIMRVLDCYLYTVKKTELLSVNRNSLTTK